MGILDSISGFTGGAQSDQAKVAGGLLQALESHPGGIQSVFQSFAANGLNGHATAIVNGETPAMTPEQVQQGLGGTGLIEKTAEHSGLSPQMVQMALTTVLPLVMAHFASNSAAAGTPGGTPGVQQGGLSGMAESILKKFM